MSSPEPNHKPPAALDGIARDAGRAIDIAFRLSFYALMAMFALMIAVFGLAAFFSTEGTLGHRFGMAATGMAFPALGLAAILLANYVRAKIIGALFGALRQGEPGQLNAPVPPTPLRPGSPPSAGPSGPRIPPSS